MTDASDSTRTIRRMDLSTCLCRINMPFDLFMLATRRITLAIKFQHATGLLLFMHQIKCTFSVSTQICVLNILTRALLLWPSIIQRQCRYMYSIRFLPSSHYVYAIQPVRMNVTQPDSDHFGMICLAVIYSMYPLFQRHTQHR
jgi:hypothetical protein